MRKRSWTRTIVVSGFLSIVAAPPLLATEESALQRAARVGRSVDEPHVPGTRDPITIPAGDDDMPNGSVRPARSPMPIGTAVPAPETDRAGWLRSLWTRLQQLGDSRGWFRARL